MTREDYLPFGRPNFSDQEIAAVGRVLRSGWVGMGPETMAFEEELAAAVRAPYVVTVNSCTSALFLSLLVAGVGEGDEVICPSLTWCSTANAAMYLGARPVFCDVGPDTFCATPELVLERLSTRTKAVLVVHFGGYAVDVQELRRALPSHVQIIEDAAHAFGARYPCGSPVGSSGNFTCFSFYANKNLSTAEGGAIALCDREAADRMRSLRQHALPLDAWKRFTHAQSLLLSNQLTELGYKMNYTDLQAAIGRVQLARWPEFHARRLEIAQTYVTNLADVSPPVRFQTDCLDDAHARHLFLVRLPVDDLEMTRDEVVLGLRAKNIGASIHYSPLHTMPLYPSEGQSMHLTTTVEIARDAVTLPISASMTVADADYVTTELKAVLRPQLV